jgi:hypothetical protein
MDHSIWDEMKRISTFLNKLEKPGAPAAKTTAAETRKAKP